ncbi:winged helix-turn-helix transcriptional regulator [Cryobacterium sp. AP23]
MTTGTGGVGKNVLNADFTSRDVLTQTTGRWGGVALAALIDGPLRFAELGRAIPGISDRMLAQTLQRLEAHGLVSRTPHPTVPLRVDYELTDLGRPIAQSICDLITTINRQLPGIVAYQQQHPAAPTPSKGPQP